MINRLKPKSEFSRNVLTLMTGTTIAQAIPIVISPILTRIYTPEDFGVFALYVSIVNIVASVSTGKYELAIMNPKSDKDAANVAVLSIILVFIVSIFSLIIIYLFHEQLVTIIGNEKITKWLYMIPVSVILISIYNTFNYWSNREKRYKDMSNSIVIQSSSNATFNISFGLLGFGGGGMILTNIIGIFLSLSYLVNRNFNDIITNKQYISYYNIKENMFKFKQFPLMTLPQNFIYTGTLQLPIIFIKLIFGYTILGFFSLAYRVIGTPVSILGNSLGQVLYQKMSEMYSDNRKEELYKYVQKMFIQFLVASVVAGAIIAWFLPDIFSFAFGRNWKEAGVIAQFLMIYFIFAFAVTPFSKLYLLTENNLFYLKWEFIRFIMLVSVLCFGYFMHLDSNYFFFIFSMAHLVNYIYLSIPILNFNSFLWKKKIVKSPI